MNNEFKEIEDLLSKADVGSDRYKQTIFNKLKYRMETGTLKTNNNLENNCVNKKKIFKPAKVAALALATVLVGTGAAYGSQMISEIIQRFSVGNTKIVQYNIDDELKNSLSNGTPLETSYSTESIGVNEEKVFKLKNLKESANSNIKFFNYLPEGFEFKDGNSESNGNDVFLTYENKLGETISIFSFLDSKTTQSIATIEEIREEHIDGKNVVITGNSAVWESEGVTYQLYLNSNKDENNSINVEELSKMIKSMK